MARKGLRPKQGGRELKEAFGRAGTGAGVLPWPAAWSPPPPPQALVLLLWAAPPQPRAGPAPAADACTWPLPRLPPLVKVSDLVGRGAWSGLTHNPWTLGLGAGPSRCPPIRRCDGSPSWGRSGGQPADSGRKPPSRELLAPSECRGVPRVPALLKGCPVMPVPTRSLGGPLLPWGQRLGVAQTCPGYDASQGWECVSTLGTGTAREVVAPGSLGSPAAGSSGQREAVWPREAPAGPPLTLGRGSPLARGFLWLPRPSPSSLPLRAAAAPSPSVVARCCPTAASSVALSAALRLQGTHPAHTRLVRFLPTRFVFLRRRKFHVTL